MLSNQKFIDPAIATQIHKLQQQMKHLIQAKVNIQNNPKLTQQTKQKMLKYNDYQRVKLTKIIQKSKLSMVDYLDKQVHIISKQCIMNGQKVRLIQQQSPYILCNKEIVSIQRLDNGDINCSFDKQQQKSLQTTTTMSRSNVTNTTVGGTNRRSYSGVMLMGEISERNSSKNNVNQYDYSNRELSQMSPLFNSSSCHITNEHTQKLKVTSFLQSYQQNRYYQQQQLQEEETMVQQLYMKKINCLQQKCNKLQQQNIQLNKIIEYQQRTIQQISVLLDEKDKRLTQLQQKQRVYKQKQNDYRNKLKGTINTITSQLMIANNKKSKKMLSYNNNNSLSRQQLVLQSLQLLWQDCNKIYSGSIDKINSSLINNSSLKNHIPIISHLPELTPPIHQLHDESSIQNFVSYSDVRGGQSMMSQKNNKNNSNDDLLQLTRQLLELKQMLRKIQVQNQQLKGQRSLLLKKIKIIV